MIPKEPELKVSSTATASYFNFKAVTEGRPVGDKPQFSYWDVNLYVPIAKTDEWKEAIKPGKVFYIEHGTVELVKLETTKFPITRVRCEHNRVKEMDTPLWTKG